MREPFPDRVVEGPGPTFPGEETALLESLEGKGVVRACPPYPPSLDCTVAPDHRQQCPTFASIPNILSRGGAWHAGLGTEQLVEPSRYSWAGVCEASRAGRSSIGLSLHQVLEQFGEEWPPAHDLPQVGGPLGASLPEHRLDIKHLLRRVRQGRAVLGHGGIVVYDHETDMVDLATLHGVHRRRVLWEMYALSDRFWWGVRFSNEFRRGGTMDDLRLLDDLGETMKPPAFVWAGERPIRCSRPSNIFPQSLEISCQRSAGELEC